MKEFFRMCQGLSDQEREQLYKLLRGKVKREEKVSLRQNQKLCALDNAYQEMNYLQKGVAKFLLNVLRVNWEAIIEELS